MTLDVFQSGSIQTAQAERQEASDSWLAERRRRDEKACLAIRIIKACRAQDPVTSCWTELTDDAVKLRATEQDERITAELARHGLTWDDCDFP